MPFLVGRRILQNAEEAQELTAAADDALQSQIEIAALCLGDLYRRPQLFTTSTMSQLTCLTCSHRLTVASGTTSI
jgi:hypothetical protein